MSDNLTGLMWTKNANMYGQRNWSDALSVCASCTEGGYGDWRLSNVRELHSLIDYGRFDPALPAGHPFSKVQSWYYWSSTTFANSFNYGWGLSLAYGSIVSADTGHGAKNGSGYVWCVRGGQ